MCVCTCILLCTYIVGVRLIGRRARMLLLKLSRRNKRIKVGLFYFTNMFPLLYLSSGKGQSRVVTKTVPNESFFNFFSPPDREYFCKTFTNFIQFFSPFIYTVHLYPANTFESMVSNQMYCTCM